MGIAHGVLRHHQNLFRLLSSDLQAITWIRRRAQIVGCRFREASRGEESHRSPLARRFGRLLSAFYRNYDIPSQQKPTFSSRRESHIRKGVSTRAMGSHFESLTAKVP